jgi:2-polyprenyl-3-methyl-5-hydroxy-6-metoxy-1,4-benzoquinol methylase
MRLADAPFVDGEWPREGLERVERCPACGGSRRRLLYANLTDRTYQSAPGRWSLFRCEHCSCAFLDPRPDHATAPLAYRTYYEGCAAGSPMEQTEHRLRRFRRALRNGYLNSKYGYRARPASALGRLLVPLVPQYRDLADEHVRHLELPAGSPRLLDVGCGEGEFLAQMQALGWSVAGLDPSAEAVSIAQARNVAVSTGTLSEAELEPHSLDAITFRLVFEHLSEPSAALARCRKALRRGGILWIATPSLDSEAHRVFGRDWIHLEAPRHAVLYTKGALARLISEAGFELSSVKPYRQARWSFRLSAALARGLPPFEKAPPLPRRLAARAALADLRALRRPEKADVIVLLAIAR